MDKELLNSLFGNFPFNKSVHENSIFTELGTHNFLKIQSAGPVFLFE